MAAVLAWELYDRSVNDKPEMEHPVVAAMLVALAGGFTAVTSSWVRSHPHRLLAVPTIVVELAIAGALLAANEWVWGDTSHSQNLASAWPLMGVLVAGTAFGRRAGLAAGFCLAVAGYLGIPLANDGAVSWSLARISSGVLFMLAGWIAGYLAFRLRQAEDKIAVARAREEVARTLHDGVLQTLAVIQRRSSDSELVTLARDQERELRRFLVGDDEGEESLLSALRGVARRHEQRHPTKVQVVAVEPLPEASGEVAGAVSRAVGEALTNASKHGGATNVTVFVEEADDEGIFCSVKDNGTGFEAHETSEASAGMGLTRSITGRIEEIGGRVEVAGNPGRGAEIRIWTAASSDRG
jgi:signal transduction histidine kinase